MRLSAEATVGVVPDVRMFVKNGLYLQSTLEVGFYYLITGCHSLEVPSMDWPNGRLGPLLAADDLRGLIQANLSNGVLSFATTTFLITPQH